MKKVVFNEAGNQKLADRIEELEIRRLRAKRMRLNILAGFRAFGIVGWTVALPTIGGVYLGRWLEKVSPQKFSWTLTCLICGLILGSVAAWNWISKENRNIKMKDK